ncbi:serine hydrolase [Streptomyces sp. NPDC004237]|uniref:serine hydrolase n=1 Tax=Streptomyces sp. NPDC004237 TaxID=3154455 RepID=UPI0033ACBC80
MRPVEGTVAAGFENVKDAFAHAQAERRPRQRPVVRLPPGTPRGRPVDHPPERRRPLRTGPRPVAAYWPEFASGGKEDITVADVLAHRSGLYVFGHYRRPLNTVIRRTSSGGVSVNNSPCTEPPDGPRNAMLRMTGLRRPRTCPRADRGRDHRVRLAAPGPFGRLQP